MGYIHEQGISVFVPPGLCLYSAGTWADTEATNVWSKNRTAAAGGFKVNIPATVLHQLTAANKGSYLTSVDLFWQVDTLALTSLAGNIYKMTNPAHSGAWVAAAQGLGYDTDHLAAGQRITTGLHKMTLTLTAGLWIAKDYNVYALLDVVPQATSVFKFFGAQWNYTLRI